MQLATRIPRARCLIVGWLVCVLARGAAGQIDCGLTGSDCSTTKYGLGLKPDYRKDEIPPDPFRYTTDFFGPPFGGQSYFVARTYETASNGSCGRERALSPLPGQIILTDENCTPTSFGPACTAGANTGTACHLPTLNEGCTGAAAPLACCISARTGTCDGFASSAPNSVECGAGGTCSAGAGTGCRVQIENSDGGYTAVADASEVLVFSITYQAIAPNGDRYNLSASVGNTIGGTSQDGTWGVPDCTGPGVPAACCSGPGTGSCQPLTACTLSSGTTQGNVRRRPTMGTRYLLPANRGGGSGQTYVRWDSVAGLARAVFTDQATGFRIHTDDAAVCCEANHPELNTCCPTGGSCFPPPFGAPRTCSVAGRFINEDNVTPDWIFAGDRGTAFHTDDDFVLPGTIPGVCKNNRFTSCYNSDANSVCAASGMNFLGLALACCTGPGTGTCTANTFCTSPGQPFACCTAAGAGTCGDPCPGLGDTCDLRSPGPRVQVGAGARNANNDARFDYCGGSLYILRGTPNQGCSLLPRRAYNGDPGPDCGVLNYGADHRDDANCDGVADLVDLCPFYSEWDQDADGDRDCHGTPGAGCRGDECECGDQDGNGRVNVSDLIAINQVLFGSATRKRLCDATNDSLCDVSDIVAANREIFAPGSSVCRQITPRQCGAKFCTGGPTPGAACTMSTQCGPAGFCPYEALAQPCCSNGVIEAGEFCDDADLAPGDGCNGACQVEFGFTCAGQPSVCSPS